MNNNMKKPGSKKETENEQNAGNDENSTKSISFIQLFRFVSFILYFEVNVSHVTLSFCFGIFSLLFSDSSPPPHPLSFPVDLSLLDTNAYNGFCQ